MFHNYNDLLSLKDTEPFIDYIELNAFNLPTAWYKNILYNNPFTMKINGKKIGGVVKYNKPNNEKPCRKIIYKFSNGVIMTLYGLDIRDNIECEGSKGAVKLEIKSESLPALPIYKQIDFIKDIIEGIECRYSLNDFYKNKKHRKYLNLRTLKISRLDLALNIEYPGNYLNDLNFIFNLQCLQKRWNDPHFYGHRRIENKGYATGISIGSGKKDSIQLKFYDKNFDRVEAKIIANSKYNRTDFMRWEYKVQRPKLRMIKSDNYEMNSIDTLNELDYNQCMATWEHCINNKIFKLKSAWEIDRKRNSVKLKNYGKNKTITQEDYDNLPYDKKIKFRELSIRRYKMIKSMLFNYSFVGSSFNSIDSSLDSFFINNEIISKTMAETLNKKRGLNIDIF